MAVFNLTQLSRRVFNLPLKSGMSWAKYVLARACPRAVAGACISECVLQ